MSDAPGPEPTPRGLRWALIGASDIAAGRVLPAIRATGGEAVVVRSGDAAHAAAYAAEHGIARAVTDVDAAVDVDDVDAVYVSSVNQQHYEHVMAAAGAGKHVLAEKPLALRLDHAREMVGACRDAGVVIATNHHLPASPVHRVLRRAVAEGMVGQVRAIRFQHAVQLPPRLIGWRVHDAEGGGVVLDVTVHDAAAIAAILGSHALSVTASALSQDNRDTDRSSPPDAVMTTALWGNPTGGPEVLVQTHDAYNNRHLPTGVHILGTDGALVADDCNGGGPEGSVSLWREHRREPLDVPDRTDLYLTTVAAFTAAVRGQGEVLVSGEDGVASLAVALGVNEALRTGQRRDVEPVGL
jgi:1,5-anhydro-D-fructose reductase (1,5-anhydro-D-mannitol-forming)